MADTGRLTDRRTREKQKSLAMPCYMIPDVDPRNNHCRQHGTQLLHPHQQATHYNNQHHVINLIPPVTKQRMGAEDTSGKVTSACVLPGYQAQMNESGVQYSEQKLKDAAKDLVSYIEKDGNCAIASFPCQKEEDTLEYRCKCSFQIVHNGVTGNLQYAMRHKGKPVPIGSSSFPIANKRIQLAMKGLIDQVLNNRIQNFSRISTNLASVTFAASWKDDFDDNNPLQSASDCIVTLNYDSAFDNEERWMEEARQICNQLYLSQLNGRSKKRLLSARLSSTESVPIEKRVLGSVLRDTIWLVPGTTWDVSLQQPSQEKCIPVYYQKPEGAFFHPNAYVMRQALKWMLNQIADITKQSTSSCRLLEMYCGCGAHSVAIAKSRLLSSIHAVELDPRLVDACNINIELNNATNNEEANQINKTTPTSVVRGDAGEWAKEQQRKAASSSKYYQSYDILLLDPPRQGLDDEVIHMAIHGEVFQHILIISCGHDALVRDLKILCEHFEIIDCNQLDLFPRTDSVETLVHLRRKTTMPCIHNV